MSKKKFFSVKTLISLIISLIILSCSVIVIAGPNLEKDIKRDISKYINYLNEGEISQYYNLYNTRKLNELEKSLFYEKIKNATKIMASENETYKKFRLKVKVKDVNILEKINNNLYLCNLSVDYQIREHINTTKTIKKSEEYIVKILYVGKDGYKILLPFNSMDKDFSETETFKFIEQVYKDKKAKEIEKQRLQKEKEDKATTEKEESADKEIVYEDENGLNSTKKEEKENDNTSEKSSQEQDKNSIDNNISGDSNNNTNNSQFEDLEDNSNENNEKQRNQENE